MQRYERGHFLDFREEIGIRNHMVKKLAGT